MPFLFGYFKFTHLGLILGKLGFAPPIVAIRAMLLKRRGSVPQSDTGIWKVHQKVYTP